MDPSLFEMQPVPVTTWAIMSSLLMLALFFKFNRFWSVRNFDLLLIILLAPGMLMVQKGIELAAQSRLSQGQDNLSSSSALDGEDLRTELSPSTGRSGDAESTAVDRQRDRASQSLPSENLSELTGTDLRIMPPGSASGEVNPFKTPAARTQRWGYCWLFVVTLLFLIRMLIDPNLIRRPLLDPNLNSGGLIFLGISLMAFLFTDIVVSRPSPQELRGMRDAVRLMQRRAADEGDAEQLIRQGPGYWLFNAVSLISTAESGGALLQIDPDESEQLTRYVIAAKSLAITCQVLIVLGLVWFCRINFDSFNIGVGLATIYLMTPYTTLFTGQALHTLPAALMVWSLVCFRRPWLAGILMGLATGVSYYPIFLLPLWSSFYWDRGAKPFLLGVAISLGIGVLGQIFTSPDLTFFLYQVRKMFGFLWPRTEGLEGIWALGWSYWYRLPLLVAHIALSISFIFWPSEKNLGTLIAYSAALMAAVQFWLGFGGGLHVAWYLPLALLVFFRPNLSGKVALTELNERNWRVRAETAEDLIPS